MTEVLLTKLRVGHGLYQRHQYRHILRAATSHYSVNRNVPYCGLTLLRQEYTDNVVSRTVCVPQKLFNPLYSGWDDGHPITPFLFVEEPVHFIKRALEYDISRLRLWREFRFLRLYRQTPDNLINHNCSNVLFELLNRVEINWPRVR